MVLENIDELAQELTKTPSRNPKSRREQGLNVYRMNYLFSHIDMLGENFAASRNVLGDQNFKFFGREYLIANPPSDPNIEQFGSTFAEFLAQREELQEVPYVAEVAKIDWMWATRFAAPREIETFGGILSIWNLNLEGEGDEDMEYDPDSSVLVRLMAEGDSFFFQEFMG